jgi:hypothetical protein
MLGSLFKAVVLAVGGFVVEALAQWGSDKINGNNDKGEK